jgi:hypothetical protein
MAVMVGPSFELQPRDIEVLTALFESRVMTAKHIAALHFSGSYEATKQRLRKLKTAGLIGEHRRKSTDPAVLSLTTKALGLLKERGILANYPKLDTASLNKRKRVSELTLKHELEVMDVKSAIHSAITKTSGFTIEEFSTWPRLNEFEAFRSGNAGKEVLVKPDGFIHIMESESSGCKFERFYFLEVDRSTETQDTLVARANCYRDFFKSGGFAARRNAPRTNFEDYPFYVLMVFKNAERRNNTAERLLQQVRPIRRLTLLSTFEEVTTSPLGAIWIRPSEYDAVTIHTPFEARSRPPAWNYKRQSSREEFVEKNVKKFGMLDERD